jgi:hypothetical protein
MATLVEPTNIQKIEFDVTTVAPPSRVTIVTGRIPIELMAQDDADRGNVQRVSYKVLLDPTLTPGQFRKATSTVSLGGMSAASGGASSFNLLLVIDDAQATLDDEAGRVQLVVDVTVMAQGTNVFSRLMSLMFQVTTLATV